MGMFLLLILSLFFGWCFTEHKNRQLELIQSQLDKERMERRKEKEEYEFIVNRLKITIREML